MRPGASPDISPTPPTTIPRSFRSCYYTFWGMTALLIGTFTVSGVHTLLWLPRALQMRRELRAAEARRSGSRKELWQDSFRSEG